jgi:hypothetical protein
VIFAAFLGVVWCFHATERKCTTSGSRTCSMKSESFAQNKIVPVIVTNNEPRSKDFLQYAASELNLNLKYVNIDEFDHSKLNDNSITIVNAGVDASNKLDSLKLVGYLKIWCLTVDFLYHPSFCHNRFKLFICLRMMRSLLHLPQDLPQSMICTCHQPMYLKRHSQTVLVA